MSIPQSAQGAPADSLAYAESLYGYAAERLDALSLRCWIVQRLMLDEGLDHTGAETVFGQLLASAPKVDTRGARRLGRERRRGSSRDGRANAYISARRRLHRHRPAGHACGRPSIAPAGSVLGLPTDPPGTTGKEIP